MTTLFHTGAGDVTDADIRSALLACGAADCDVLYVHTGMSFGLPATGRKHLLGGLLDIFQGLGVETLVFPTFTFSFCNNEPFDIDKSPTPMGALNEFARKSGRARRSADPLLSVCVIGKDPGLTEDLSQYSIGEGSSYDRLHKCGKKVKFLFFGTDMRDCFTYTHYLEAVVRVPYRYDREFSGVVVRNGIECPTSVWLYSTYANCRLNPVPVVHDFMEQAGMLRKGSIGEGTICCFDEKDGYDAIAGMLAGDPLCLTDGSFREEEKDMRYNINGERVVSVR